MAVAHRSTEKLGRRADTQFSQGVAITNLRQVFVRSALDFVRNEADCAIGHRKENSAGMPTEKTASLCRVIETNITPADPRDRCSITAIPVSIYRTHPDRAVFACACHRPFTNQQSELRAVFDVIKSNTAVLPEHTVTRVLECIRGIRNHGAGNGDVVAAGVSRIVLVIVWAGCGRAMVQVENDIIFALTWRRKSATAEFVMDVASFQERNEHH